jgi:uncharacterized iron-regulated protein
VNDVARPVGAGWILALAIALGGCASSGSPFPSSSSDGSGDGTQFARSLPALLPADVLLIGEQHDAPAHHALERTAVETLAARSGLAALAVEMAEEGHDTAGLPPTATEAQVRAALHWDEAAWPWSDYAATVMAAVRAGVPVVGANLPRARMRDAMADVSLDAQLPDAALRAQRDAVRDGHCGLLPEAQIVPMTRIQVARDRAMAQVVAKARRPGRTVLLIAGAAHVDRRQGVPQHLPVDVTVRSLRLLAADAGDEGATASTDRHDVTWRTAPLPAKDYCAGVRRPG